MKVILQLINLAFLLFSVVSAAQIVVGHSNLTYRAGTWTITDPEFVCGGGALFSVNDIGAEVSLTFRGTGVALYLPRAPQGANVEINLDGQKLRINTRKLTYDCTSSMYDIHDLRFSQHTISVKSISDGFLYVSKFVYTVPDIPSALIATDTVIPTATAAIHTPTPAADTTQSTISRNVIIGAACGGVFGLLLLCGLAYMLYRKVQKRAASLDDMLERTKGAKQGDKWSDTSSIQSVEKIHNVGV